MDGIRRRMRLLVAVLCAASVLLPAAGALADPEQQLEEVQQRLERTRDNLEEIEQERGVTLEDLERIDAELSQLDANLAALQAELADAEDALAEAEQRLAQTTAELIATEQRLADTRDRLDGERQVFADRTRSSFMFGGPAQMTASMLDVSDAAELGRAIKYVERVMASDRDRVNLVAGLVREIEADTAELEVLQAREAEARRAAEHERDRVAGLVDEERALREQVAAQRATRQAALNELDADKEAHLELAAALEAESEKLEEELRRRAEEEERRRREAEERRRREAAQRDQRSGSADSGASEEAPASSGQLQRPTAGPMTSGFGYRTHPIFGTRRMHTGIDFGGGYGAPIYAAESGVVVSAGARGGYGLTVIIDHGGGMTTLYAHQSRFAVSSGQQVARGQLIGYIGSTGVSTGPHLHFEVRINGSPRDPRGYL